MTRPTRPYCSAGEHHREPGERADGRHAPPRPRRSALASGMPWMSAIGRITHEPDPEDPGQRARPAERARDPRLEHRDAAPGAGGERSRGGRRSACGLSASPPTMRDARQERDDARQLALREALAEHEERDHHADDGRLRGEHGGHGDATRVGRDEEREVARRLRERGVEREAQEAARPRQLAAGTSSGIATSTVPNVRLPAGSQSSGTCRSRARPRTARGRTARRRASRAGRPAAGARGRAARARAPRRARRSCRRARSRGPSSVSAGRRSPVANEIAAATPPSVAPRPGDERHRAELDGAVEGRERRDGREARDREPDEAARVDLARASCAKISAIGSVSMQPAMLAPAEHADRADDARRTRVGDRGRAPQERREQAADDPRHACVPAITATPIRRPGEAADLTTAEALAEHEHAADDREHRELRGEHRRDRRRRPSDPPRGRARSPPSAARRRP